MASTSTAGPAPVLPQTDAAVQEHAHVTAPPAVEPMDTEVDDALGDADSTFDDDVASYTTSLASSVTDYKYENGRRYHAYKEGSYIWPNDEKERDRLDILHKLVEVSMDDKLFWAPIKNPKRVLDLGTGTGIWAMEFADQFPNADVLGNDLSPIQPRWVPPNVHFEVDDVESEWTYSQPFDLVHSRAMSNAIKDWPRYVRQCFEHTAPGGYSEFQDFDSQWVSPDNSIPPDSAMIFVITAFMKISRENGTDPSPGPSLEGWCRDAGFVDIKVVRRPLPVGTWPADKKLKQAGAWNYLQLTEGVEGLLLAVFSRYMGMTKEEIMVLAARLMKDFKDPKIHAMAHFYNVIGRKPESKDQDDQD